MIAAWLECFPEKPSWCQEVKRKTLLSCPTDCILRYIKPPFFVDRYLLSIFKFLPIENGGRSGSIYCALIMHVK